MSEQHTSFFRQKRNAIASTILSVHVVVSVLQHIHKPEQGNLRVIIRDFMTQLKWCIRMYALERPTSITIYL